jgi:hypothetical protein
MISGLREQQIHQCALEVVQDNGFTTLPVDPRAIAGKASIQLQSWQPTKPGISGFLMRHGDSFGIGYSTAIKNEGFTNFTIGHELGHYFLDGHAEALLQNEGNIHYSQSGFVSNDLHEREADCFAAELLMPAQFFKGALRQSGSGFSAIEKIAGLARTSIVATGIKLAKLTEDPLAVILCSGNQVEWSFISPELKKCRGVYILEKKSPIPSDSVTNRYVRDGKNVLAGDRLEGFSSLQTWFERAPDVEFQEDVVGLGHYGKTLTVLFTEEALNDEDENEEDEDSDNDLPSNRWHKRDQFRED